MTQVLGEQRLQRLIDVGGMLVSELDLDTLLTRLLEAAQELTGAGYAALGVLDADRREIERFLTRGVDLATSRAIGDPPHGRGILGLLIADPRPLRLHDIGADPRSYGFPSGHPPMRSFLGVPIALHGEAWGNLYLTDKRDGDFDAADERTAATLANWAAIAIEHADLYRRLRERGDRLERSVRSFEATTTVTRAVGAETRLDRVLEMIVKRGRALVGARALLILLEDGDALLIAAGAGEFEADALGRRIPVHGTTAGAVLQAVRPERNDDVAARLRVTSERLGVPVDANRLGVHDPHTALLVPLEFRSRKLGVLVAFDRAGEQVSFDGDQQALLLAFAASEATAVATAQSAERRRLRERMAAAERERQRWAHELHDQTLQSLASFRVLIDATLERADPAESERTLRTLATRVDGEIEQLRALITELRPAALDEQGLAPAIEHLAQQVSGRHGIAVETDMALGATDGGAPAPHLDPDTETAIYRVVQEALTNVVKHAGASHVTIGVRPREEGVDIVVSDDGAGFDPDAPREGFGIAGMHERVELANGTFAIASRPGAGTSVHVWLHADA